MAHFISPSDDSIAEAIGVAIKMDDGNAHGKFEGFELKYVERYAPDTDPQQLLPFFVPDASSFSCIDDPGAHDWLSNHKEAGQTFLQFVTASTVCPIKSDRIIYLQPFNIEEENVPSDILNAVAEYSRIFFGFQTIILEPVCLKGDVPERVNPFSKTLQVNAKNVLEELKTFRPEDGFCLAGITLCDLYPRDEWNFVFGLANKKVRTGVHSLARYLPSFGSQPISIYDKSSEKQTLQRSCKVLTHEISHMFGLSHCIYFRCLMNGSNHLDEMDSRPMFLCPVCLRKLHYACGFDIMKRYEQMFGFWNRWEQEAEMKWLAARISFLRPDISD